MNASDYQRLAARTLIDKPDFDLSKEDLYLIVGLIKLASALGSAFEKVKKGILHQHGFDKEGFDSDLALIDARVDDVRCRSFPFCLPSPLTNQEIMTAWNLVGLVGETGEISSLYTNAILGGPRLGQEQSTKELGDVLWYVAALCSKLGLDMSDVMETNIEKLKKRYPDGYKSADSIARVDVVEV